MMLYTIRQVCLAMLLVRIVSYVLRSAAVCMQLSSFLPSATPLPELKAVATGSFAGMTPTHFIPASCCPQLAFLAVVASLNR